MTRDELVLERLRAADPAPTDARIDPDDLSMIFSLLEEKRDAMTTQTPIRPSPPVLTPRRRLHPALAFGIPIAIAAIAVVAGLLLTASDNQDEVITPTKTTIPTQTTTPTTTPQATPATTTSTTIESVVAADLTWTRIELPGSESEPPELFGAKSMIGTGPNEIFVGDGYFSGDQTVYVSTNGEDWEKVEGLPTGQAISSITYGDGTYLAVGGSGSGVLMEPAMYTSRNLRDWVAVEDSPSLYSPRSLWDGGQTIAYGNGRFVAVGPTEEPLHAGIWGSSDGHEWSLVEDRLGATQGYHLAASWVELADIAYGPSGFVMVGTEHLESNRTAAAVWHSPDGIEWGRIADATGVFASASAGGGLDSVTSGADGYLAANSFGDSNVWFSPDGEAWERTSAEGRNLNVVAFGDGYLAVGTERPKFFGPSNWVPPLPLVLSSTDGRTWEPLTMTYSPAEEEVRLRDAEVTDTAVVVAGDRTVSYEDEYGTVQEFAVTAIWYAPLP